MKNKTEIKVFIASPGDTFAERNLLHKYIEEWNTNFGDDDRNIQLKIVMWEKDLAIRSNISAQEAIIEDLVKDCDILTGIFWTKFGSPTKKAESGTVEEIEYFLDNKKPVLMYFLDRPIKPSDVERLKDDLHKINEFKIKYQPDNIYRLTDLSDIDLFRNLFIKDLNRNIRAILEKRKEKENKENDKNQKRWYEESIKQLIDKQLAEYELPLAYRREISFDENIKLWRTFVEARHPAILHLLTLARQEAFNKKYGRYDYETDLREKYKESWYIQIHNILSDENYTHRTSFNVLGVASNNGVELYQIFKNYSNVDLSVLDLSDVATKSGNYHNKNIKFIHGNMEDCTIPNSSVDIYLNLRSIHSSGVDIRMTLAECYRLLKPDGIAIVSVSNGYLTPNEIRKDELVETKGMYDNRIEAFSTDKPYELINKIRVKMDSYGFRNIQIHTGQTEIFIKAKK